VRECEIKKQRGGVGRKKRGRGEGGVWREKWSASEVDVELTVPKARSRSREGATLDEAPRISLRESL